MTRDARTIAVYDSRAGDYARLVGSAENDPDLERFLGKLAGGGRILDLGCGPGLHAAAMKARGFEVVAMDASPAMTELARRHAGIEVRDAGFADLTEVAAFDGIWANFSLLHAPRAEMPDHLARIRRALRPGGILHLGMKTGSGEGRDRLGRFYTYYSLTELQAMTEAAGFAVEEKVTGEGAGLSGEIAPWAVVLARRPMEPATAAERE